MASRKKVANSLTKRSSRKSRYTNSFSGISQSDPLAPSKSSSQSSATSRSGSRSGTGSQTGSRSRVRDESRRGKRQSKMNRAGTLDGKVRRILRQAGSLRLKVGRKRRPPIGAQTFYMLSDNVSNIHNIILAHIAKQMEMNNLKRVTHEYAQRFFELTGSHQNIVDDAVNLIRANASKRSANRHPGSRRKTSQSQTSTSNEMSRRGMSKRATKSSRGKNSKFNEKPYKKAQAKGGSRRYGKRKSMKATLSNATKLGSMMQNSNSFMGSNDVGQMDNASSSFLGKSSMRKTSTSPFESMRSHRDE